MCKNIIKIVINTIIYLILFKTPEDKNKILQKSKNVLQELVQKWYRIKNDTDFQIKVDHWLQELNAISITKKITSNVFGETNTIYRYKNPKNVSVKIPQNSVSQSNEQVIGPEADDSEPSTSNLATSRIATAQFWLSEFWSGRFA